MAKQASINSLKEASECAWDSTLSNSTSKSLLVVCQTKPFYCPHPQAGDSLWIVAVQLKACTAFSVKSFTAWLNIDIPGLWYVDSIVLTSKAARCNTCSQHAKWLSGVLPWIVNTKVGSCVDDWVIFQLSRAWARSCFHTHPRKRRGMPARWVTPCCVCGSLSAGWLLLALQCHRPPQQL